LHQEKIMAIRDLIEQIAGAWPVYHQKGRVDKNDPAYALVVKQFPEAIRPHIAGYDTIMLEGSTGAGNITAAPMDRTLRQALHYKCHHRLLHCLSLFDRYVDRYT
jgi:hypothetical protein